MVTLDGPGSAMEGMANLERGGLSANYLHFRSGYAKSAYLYVRSLQRAQVHITATCGWTTIRTSSPLPTQQ